jgi:hypothetical protein
MPFCPKTLTLLVRAGQFVSAREYVTKLLTSGDRVARRDIADWFCRVMGTLPLPVGLVRVIIPNLSVMDVATMNPLIGYTCNMEAGLLRLSGARFCYLDAFVSRAKDDPCEHRGLEPMIKKFRSMQYLQILSFLCFQGDTDTAKLLVSTHGRVPIAILRKHVSRFYRSHSNTQETIISRAMEADLVSLPPREESVVGFAVDLSATCRVESKLERIAAQKSNKTW